MTFEASFRRALVDVSPRGAGAPDARFPARRGERAGQNDTAPSQAEPTCLSGRFEAELR